MIGLRVTEPSRAIVARQVVLHAIDTVATDFVCCFTAHLKRHALLILVVIKHVENCLSLPIVTKVTRRLLVKIWRDHLVAQVTETGQS